jgi:acyl-CoA dehydrogenase
VPLQTIENLKPKAQAAGLWNLFLPVDNRRGILNGAGLTNQEYAPLAKSWAACHGPAKSSTARRPTPATWKPSSATASDPTRPAGSSRCSRARSARPSLMTEPDVASSDATNIATRIEREGDEYVINGRKWWSSGAGDPRCAVFITMGKTDPDAPRHSQHKHDLVPANAKGIKIVRPLTVFGYDDAPHGHMEVLLENVRVPVQHPAGRRPRLRNRPRAPWPRAASTTACASIGWPSARWN